MIEATLIDHMGDDLSVVNAARVSFGKESDWEWESDDWDSPWKLSERDTKLIQYLARHKHLSPFGHCFASFHVKAPVFVARQLVKHKFLRWNEVSRRYVRDEPEFYVPDVWRRAADNVKQGSSDEAVHEGLYMMHQYNDFVQISLETYERMLRQGVAPEQARMVLPQSMMTEWWWSGSLDAFAAMCVLRCAADTQAESRIVAEQISEKMLELFPVSWKALMQEQGDSQ